MSVETTYTLTSKSSRRTANFGRHIGELAPGGLVIALTGPLGAGKTRMAQGIARGLGIDEPLASPSFLLHRTYPGRFQLHHFDFYRLESEDDLESIGFYDFIAGASESIFVVEWAEKFPAAFEPPILHIRIDPQADNTRRITIKAEGVEDLFIERLKKEMGR